MPAPEAKTALSTAQAGDAQQRAARRANAATTQRRDTDECGKKRAVKACAERYGAMAISSLTALWERVERGIAGASFAGARAKPKPLP